MAAAPVNFKILLRDMNAIRAATFAGEPISEMPKGIIQDATECPVARAVKNGFLVDADASEIWLYVEKDHEQHDFKAIAKALRMAGFTHVKLTTDEVWKDDEFGGGEFVDRPNGVTFRTTKTMRNFIRRFDQGEFEELIEGSAI